MSLRKARAAVWGSPRSLKLVNIGNVCTRICRCKVWGALVNHIAALTNTISGPLSCLCGQRKANQLFCRTFAELFKSDTCWVYSSGKNFTCDYGCRWVIVIELNMWVIQKLIWFCVFTFDFKSLLFLQSKLCLWVQIKLMLTFFVFKITDTITWTPLYIWMVHT